MEPDALTHDRLRNQRLVGAPLADPVAVVAHLGAVQAQDDAGAKWGIAQRLAACTDAGGRPGTSWSPRIPSPLVHLLPNYDEYFIGFRNRAAFSDPATTLDARVLGNHIVFSGGRLSAAERRALEAATQRLGAFLELPARLVVRAAR